MLSRNVHRPCRAVISERMLQYYVSEKKLPTKQALLAIAISFELPQEEIETLLRDYGFCLSNSLPNDAVALWFLRNNSPSLALVFSINEVLADLELPLLMTKQINSFGYR